MTEQLKILSPTELIALRQKVLDGYEPSDEEISQILQSLASNRSNTTRASAAKAPVKPIDLDGLFK